jgi:hypothetical protein
MSFFSLGFLHESIVLVIKVSIFCFPISGDFNELLTNLILLAAYIDVAN